MGPRLNRSQGVQKVFFTYQSGLVTPALLISCEIVPTAALDLNRSQGVQEVFLNTLTTPDLLISCEIVMAPGFEQESRSSGVLL